MTTTLEKYIDSLDPKTLPRVLQIQSGIYCGGSIYELFGNVYSISTDDVIKVIGFKIKKIIAHICSSAKDMDSLATMELPLDFPGLFKLVADKTPYHSIGEITRTLHIGTTRFGHPCFRSHADLTISNITICKDEQIRINSEEEVSGVMSVNCGVVKRGQLHSFYIPLSYEGEFYECQDEKIYTLKEILDWKIPKSRSRAVILTDVLGPWDGTSMYPGIFKGMFILKPVYEVLAVMQFGKDVVRLLTDLDIEVMDITQNVDMKSFIQTLTTHEVFERTCNEFPMIAEIIEATKGNCTSYNLLIPGKKIIFHKKYQAQRIIASELRSYSPKKHFLIPSSYKGKFKRKPRVFPTVYDLKIAMRETDHLHVVATKSFHVSHTEFSSVCVGDEFLVQLFQSSDIQHEGKVTVVDVLACSKKISTGFIKVIIPLYVEGGFLEIIHDKQQYNLSELCKSFQLPLNVKVSVRDLSTMGEDILATTAVLQLEEQITDSYLLISPFDSPEVVWELPVQRLNLSVHLVSSFAGATFSAPTRTNVEEINDEEYYMVRRYENQNQYPPPRPPKTPLNTNVSKPIRTLENLETAGASSESQVNCQEDTLQQGTEKDMTAIVETNNMKDEKQSPAVPLRKPNSGKESLYS
ncbi:protein THEMIS [Ascaphus truei]|uniref:protein THEMIS n=1 Tax=Ascaphus truei TaxID=8439 RepID=UPI003F592113